MAKKMVVGVVGLVLLGVAALGTNFFSYSKTAIRQARQTVEDSVPMDIKVANAEELVRGLDPEIKKYMRLIAEQEVDVDILGGKVAKRENGMKDAKKQILALKDALDKGEKEYVFDGQSYTSEEVRKDLDTKFNKFKLASDSLSREKDLLKVRQEALEANRGRLNEMMEAKKNIVAQLEYLKTRVETNKAEKAVGALDIDDSKMAQARKLIEDLNKKLDVDDKVRAAEGRLAGEIKVPEKKETRNVSKDIEDFFGDEAKPKTDL